MLDRPDDLLDVIGRSAERNFARQGVISRPGDPFVISARQTHASDLDDRLKTCLETIDTRFRTRDGVFPALGPYFKDMGMSDEAQRGLLSGEVGLKCLRSKESV